MLGVDPALLHQLLEQLEQASHDHAEWHERVARTIVCRLPVDPRDLGPDAHRECSFGQWYHQQDSAVLLAHPAFVAMQSEHERVHRAAARLLRACAAGVSVPQEDFDEYVHARGQLRLELESLCHELHGFLQNRDALTGAHRRLDLLAELREQLELSRRGIQACCIAFIDLDHFKAINDTHGHGVGDQVLTRVAAFVMQHLRPFDKVYRYGGDEFLVSMPGADLAAGHAVIERMREGLAALPLARVDGVAIHATASIGLALLDPLLSVEQVIENADRALFQAKAAGRNRAYSWDAAESTLTGMLPFGPDDAA